MRYGRWQTPLRRSRLRSPTRTPNRPETRRPSSHSPGSAPAALRQNSRPDLQYPLQRKPLRRRRPRADRRRRVRTRRSAAWSGHARYRSTTASLATPVEAPAEAVSRERPHVDASVDRTRSRRKRSVRACPRAGPPQAIAYGRSIANTSFAARPKADPSKWSAGEYVPEVVSPSVVGVKTKTSSSAPLAPVTAKVLTVER